MIAFLWVQNILKLVLISTLPMSTNLDVSDFYEQTEGLELGGVLEILKN